MPHGRLNSAVFPSLIRETGFGSCQMCRQYTLHSTSGVDVSSYALPCGLLTSFAAYFAASLGEALRLLIHGVLSKFIWFAIFNSFSKFSPFAADIPYGIFQPTSVDSYFFSRSTAWSPHQCSLTHEVSLFTLHAHR